MAHYIALLVVSGLVTLDEDCTAVIQLLTWAPTATGKQTSWDRLGHGVLTALLRETSPF